MRSAAGEQIGVLVPISRLNSEAALSGAMPRLDLVFMDTTSLYFEGAGGRTLGQHGYSKDHRPICGR